MNKPGVVYVCTMEYYSAIKKNEVLPFVTTWMDLEDIMLSKISQKEKVSTILFPLYVESKEKNKLTSQIETHRELADSS